MKTKFKITSVLFVFILFAFMACDKKYETADLSTVTYYPVFEVSGAPVLTLEQGTTFTDPGVKATAGGNEVPVSMTVSGVFSGYSGSTVNTDVPDKYIITYTATNDDGFANTTERTVWVAKTGDLVNSIEGLYTSTVVREGNPSPQYEDMEYLIIWKVSGNTYTITDAVGGYYSIGRGYGDDYAAQGGTITVNDISTNDYTTTAGVFPIWGNTMDINDFKVDGGTKTITYNGLGNFGNGHFAVTLTQVQL